MQGRDKSKFFIAQGNIDHPQVGVTLMWPLSPENLLALEQAAVAAFSAGMGVCHSASWPLTKHSCASDLLLNPTVPPRSS